MAPREEDPDGRDRRAVMDVDGAAGPGLAIREPVWRDQREMWDREDDRDEARDLDVMIETSDRYSRSAKDAGRSRPRATTAPLGHPRKARQLLGEDQERRPLSSRQRKDRSATKNRVEDRLPRTSRRAVREAVSSVQEWGAVNDALSRAVGDVQADAVSEDQRRQVQRIDRAIQAYERANDRSHVVYTQVRMPAYINESNVMGYLRNNVPEGSTVDFDRFSMGVHCLHELDPSVTGRGERERTVVFEVATRRGAYLGASDSLDDTRHLLPRSMRLRVVGHQLATYVRPDGSTGKRYVVQVQDLDPAHWKDQED